MGIAASGMQAASVWLSSAASNIANAQTAGQVPATPPNVPVQQTQGAVYQASNVVQAASPGGGVTAKLSPTLPSYRVAFDPNSPLANGQGSVAEPDVDIATQFVQMIQARTQFGASLAAYQAADSSYQSLLNIVA